MGKSVTVPYENATSGQAARDEITKMLRRFECEKMGFMDDFKTGEVILGFTHRGRPVQLKASAKGWAAMYLKAHPYNGSRHRITSAEHQRRALEQGTIAVSSILRDWVKGQVTAIECGVLTFEAVFMPYMLMPDGRQMIEHVTEKKLLPPPEKD